MTQPADPICTALGIDLPDDVIAEAARVAANLPPIPTDRLDQIAAVFTSARNLRPPLRQAS